MKKEQMIKFDKLPATLDEMKKMCDHLDPYNISAMTICAICTYTSDSEEGIKMLNYLRGPRPMNGVELAFIKDRFRDDCDYIPFSYFKGATPANNYKPDVPYVLEILEDHTSNLEKDYIKLYVQSGGADSPRPIKLRKKVDGTWWLWEQYLLTKIKEPDNKDPWA